MDSVWESEQDDERAGKLPILLFVNGPGRFLVCPSRLWHKALFLDAMYVIQQPLINEVGVCSPSIR